MMRVFLLAAGQPFETISGVLIHETLSDRPEYEALSYTWSDVDFPKPSSRAAIAVNGCRFDVTSNLYAALLRLRDTEEDRCLWIDAICINQQDLEERGKHVQYMHLVYQYASRVIIWLGRASEDSDVAFDQLQALIETGVAVIGEREDWKSGISAETIKQVEVTVRDAAGASKARDPWLPLARLFSRPWWKRVWIVQEVCYARDIQVYCGARKAPWIVFVSAAYTVNELERIAAIHMKRGPPQRFDATLHGLAHVGLPYLRKASEEVELMPFEQTMLQYAPYCRSTDPRDKVFALLNLIPRSDWPCAPDYTKDIAEVFIETTLHIMRRHGDLRALALCEYRDYPGDESYLRSEWRRQTSMTSLPSWVIDWTFPRMTVPFAGGIQGGPPAGKEASSGPHWSVAADNLLRVHGVLLGTIQSISSILGTRPAEFQNPGLYQAIGEYCSSVTGYPSSHELEWAILFGAVSVKEDHCCGKHVGRGAWCAGHAEPNADHVPSLDAYRDWRSAPPSSVCPLTARLVAGRLNCRRMCNDGVGNVGLGAIGMRVGDQIVQVEGCHVCLILRKIEARGSDVFRLICEVDFPQVHLSATDALARRQEIFLK